MYIFFFFKQKTAYEIYQCDWSSDVCSSDLRKVLEALFLTSIGKTNSDMVDMNVHPTGACNEYL